jgi:hypothetical protein
MNLIDISCNSSTASTTIKSNLNSFFLNCENANIINNNNNNFTSNNNNNNLNKFNLPTILMPFNSSANSSNYSSTAAPTTAATATAVAAAAITTTTTANGQSNKLFTASVPLNNSNSLLGSPQQQQQQQLIKTSVTSTKNIHNNNNNSNNKLINLTLSNNATTVAQMATENTQSMIDQQHMNKFPNLGATAYHTCTHTNSCMAPLNNNNLTSVSATNSNTNNFSTNFIYNPSDDANKAFDNVVFDILKVDPDHIAVSIPKTKQKIKFIYFLRN